MTTKLTVTIGTSSASYETDEETCTEVAGALVDLVAAALAAQRYHPRSIADAMLDAAATIRQTYPDE